MVPLAIDLCCGTGGWTDAFLRHGWVVTGIDVRCDHRYRGGLVIADVRSLDGALFRGARVIVASPPCTEFSHAQRMNGGKPTNPDMSVVSACFRIASDARAPLVLENVWGLQEFLGPAVNHWGKFYLWGDGVPALLPLGPRWKEKWKTHHRSPHARARIPEVLGNAVAHHFTALL